MSNYTATNISALEKKVNNIFQMTYESTPPSNLSDSSYPFHDVSSTVETEKK